MSFHKNIKAELPNAIDGLYGRIIRNPRDLTQYYTRQEDADAQHAISYKPQSIYSPLGTYKATELLMFAKPEIFRSQHNNELIEKIKKTIKILIAGRFVGNDIQNEIYKFSPYDEIEVNFIEEFANSEETGKQPDKILYSTANGVPFAVYNPKLRMFVPRGGELPDMEEIEDMLNDVSEVSRRYCAYYEIKIIEVAVRLSAIEREIENSMVPSERKKLENNRDQILNWMENLEYLKVEAYAEYGVGKFEFKEYLSEPEPKFDSRINEYLDIVNPNENHGIAFGFLGNLNEDQSIMASEILALPTAYGSNNSKLCDGVDAIKIDEGIYICPPVKECIDENSFSIDTIGGFPNDPQAISVRVKKNGKVFRKVYYKDENGWRFAKPKTIIDCNYLVPQDKLDKYYYIVYDMPCIEWADHGTPVSDVEYVLLFSDQESVEIIESVISPINTENERSEWKLIEVNQKAEIIQLKGEDGTVYTTLPIPNNEILKPKNNMKISLDTGGSVTVVLTDDGAANGKPHAPVYDKICYPVTLCAEDAYNKFRSNALDAGKSEEKDDKRESSLERYYVEGKAGQEFFSTRIFDVDYKAWADILKDYEGDFIKMPEVNGLYLNIKGRLLEDSNGYDENRNNELMKYMVNVLRPIILGAIKRGYCFNNSENAGNIELLISYPDNGENDDTTKRYLLIIDGMIEYLNRMLPAGHEIDDNNCIRYSEGEATTAYYLKINPTILNQSRPILVSDIGATTNDITLRIGGNAYSVSIPLAGNEITQRTLASVMKNNFTIEQITSLFSIPRGTKGNRDEIFDVVKLAKEKINDFGDGQPVSECVAAWWAISHLFKEFDFSLGVTNNVLPFQMGTEQRLLCAIPFYAYVLKKAITDKRLSLKSTILFMPSGNGSKAFKNTRRGFKEHFSKKLKSFLNDQIEEKFEGKIEFMQNSDTRKHSVAEGMIILKNDKKADKKESTIAENNEVDNTGNIDYYIHMASKDNNEIAQMFADYEESKTGVLEELNKSSEIRKKAFDKLVNDYTLSFFQENYKKYLQIELSSKEALQWDYLMRNTIDEFQFENIKYRIKEKNMNLIMSCFGMEAYALTIAMINEFTDIMIRAMQ